jgi:hypothetical protein
MSSYQQAVMEVYTLAFCGKVTNPFSYNANVFCGEERIGGIIINC